MSSSWLKTASGVWAPCPTPTIMQAVFLSTHAGNTTGAPLYEICGATQLKLPPANAWQTIDLTPLLASITGQVLSVDVGGFIIISSGTTTDDADLAVAFQQSGAGMNPLNYTAQGISPGPTVGERTVYGGWSVPVTAVAGVGANCIDYAWLRGDTGKAGEWPSGPILAWPTEASYEITVDLQRAYTAS